VVQRIINTGLPKGVTVPNDSFGYGIVRIPGALNAARYKVPADDPNPVYDAYQQWLASPQGKQFTSPSSARPGTSPAATPSAAAPGSPGVSGGMVAVLAAAGVLAVIIVAGAVVSVIAARRRRHRA